VIKVSYIPIPLQLRDSPHPPRDIRAKAVGIKCPFSNKSSETVPKAPQLELCVVLSHLYWYNIYGWCDEDFISIARSLGTKSGRRKFDMCPECPAS